jgi:hypothetical protein
MRTTAKFSATTMIALSAMLAMPASAAADATSLTVTITGGSLAISVPTNAGNLGTVEYTTEATVISGLLGEVQVTDARGAVAGSDWVASAISTALTPPAGPTIPALDIGYAVGGIEKHGTATYEPHNRVDLVGDLPVVTATAITGNNAATWNPTINVSVPGGTAPGVYSGTITHSVL